MDRSLSEEVYRFVSKHEAIISNRMDEDGIKASFTSFGNRAACKAIKDILSILSEPELEKVLEMMENKKVV
jgi:hypothetical protein